MNSSIIFVKTVFSEAGIIYYEEKSGHEKSCEVWWKLPCQRKAV